MSTSIAPLQLTPDDQVMLNACPVCDSEDYLPFCKTTHEGILVYHSRCLQCSLIYLNPRPLQSWYDSYFSDKYWETKAQKWDVNVSENTRQWRKQLHRAERYLTFLKNAQFAPRSGTRILEIGCAYGIIVQTLANRFQGLACGIEPSNVARRFAGETVGVEIIGETSRSLEEWRPEEPVDLVIFSHVLEYFADPNPVLAAIRRVISSRGLILIETPNIHFMKAAHIFHPYCYSKLSLSALLKRHGFSPAAISPDGLVPSLFSSGFFTMAARAQSDSSKNALLDRKRASPHTGSLISLGQAWFHLANRFPLNRIGGAINGHRRPLSPEAERRLEALSSKTDQLQG